MRKSKLILNIKNGNIKTDSVNDDILKIFTLLNKDISEVDHRSKVYYTPKSIDQIQRDIASIKRNYKACTICFNNCRVNRIKGEKGICGNTERCFIYKHQVEYGEEAFITPTYMLYFTGCNMKCNYCHEKYDMEKRNDCKNVTSDLIIEDIRKNILSIRTISFVGGNVEQSLLGALRIILDLEKNKIRIPIVWNSNLTCNSFVIEILNNYIDIFVPDFKFGNNICSSSISQTECYFDIIKKNLSILKSRNPIIVRHLPLRGHMDCCTVPILKELKRHGNKVILNLLISFYDDNELERTEALALAKKLKISVLEDMKDLECQYLKIY